MVGEYVLSSAHNFSLTPKFATFCCPSYFMAQEANLAPRVFATRQVIQSDGLTFGSSPITRSRKVRADMPESFRPLNTKEEHALLVKGEETTTPQVVKPLNSRVLGVQIHQENT
jgi:hypothetical protein